MSSNMLRLMIATGTVAAGVDFPARTVVITAHSKRGSEGFNNLTSSEFQQMSGRAGRRGKDSVGMCLIAPGHFSDARVFHKVANTPPEPLRSSYFASPSSVLNLLKFRSVDELRYMVNKSLASFLDRKEALRVRAQAEEIRAQVSREFEGAVVEDEIELDETSQEESLDELELEESENSAQQSPKPAALRKLEKRVRRLLRDADELEQRQMVQLELSLEGLRALNHLDENGLTEKGSWAAELCTGLVLQLAEAIEEGILYDLQEFELIALVASIAGDSHRVYFRLAKNPVEKERYNELLSYVERVRDNYNGPTTTKDTTVLPDAALTVLAWWEAEDWPAFAGILRLAGVAEGDAARVITQTADHLHQISRLFDTHPDLARLAADARKKLLRPPLSEGIIIGAVEQA